MDCPGLTYNEKRTIQEAKFSCHFNHILKDTKEDVSSVKEDRMWEYVEISILAKVKITGLTFV